MDRVYYRSKGARIQFSVNGATNRRARAQAPARKAANRRRSTEGLTKRENKESRTEHTHVQPVLARVGAPRTSGGSLNLGPDRLESAAPAEKKNTSGRVDNRVWRETVQRARGRQRIRTWFDLNQ